jgi:hypothetical protein
VSGQLPAAAALPPGERALGTHSLGGWVDPRADMDDVEKRKFLTLSGLELRPLGRQARSQLLYRLHYPSFVTVYFEKKKIENHSFVISIL